jgi:Fe-S-cluster containining protein
MATKRYVYECDQCGACCCAGYWVNLNEEDKRRLSLILLPNEVEDNYLYPNGHENGIDGSGACRLLTEFGQCSIQMDKPKCCADYEPGQTGCQWARGRAGLGPLYPVETITIGEHR